MNGFGYVKIHGIEDKREIIMVMSLAANGQCLSFQAILQGTTKQSLHIEDCRKIYKTSN